MVSLNGSDAFHLLKEIYILSNGRKEWLLTYLCIILDDEVRHVDGLDGDHLAGAA